MIRVDTGGFNWEKIFSFLFYFFPYFFIFSFTWKYFFFSVFFVAKYKIIQGL